jgi:cytochrome c oxidase cbb3-type subunit 4
MDYDTFRHLADSWGLLYLLAVFLVAVAAALRPGARKKHAEAARIPLRED